MANEPVRRIGPWHMQDFAEVKKNGIKVFSCFHCGGGSTMGYKLAGCDVVGGVEIDPEMMSVYRANNHPRHSYLMGVQEFVLLPDTELPAELFGIDILDGSPPCSTFSMAGDREKKWGGNFHFKEGQAVQHLDDLFFDFIDVAAKLKPKVVIAENVKGLILGNAKGYVKQIFQRFRAVGYTPKLFLVNAAAMGVPQRRERTIFIAVRNDIEKSIELAFNETVMTAGEAVADIELTDQELISTAPTNSDKLFWPATKIGTSYADECFRQRGKGSFFNSIRFDPRKPAFTITANTTVAMHWSAMRKFSARELIRFQTFPEDFNFLDSRPGYLIGMSVPPFMMQRIALDVCRQVFGIDYDTTITNGFAKCAVPNQSRRTSKSSPEIQASARSTKGSRALPVT